MAGSLAIGLPAVGLVAPGAASAEATSAAVVAQNPAPQDQQVEIADGIYDVTAKMADPEQHHMVRIQDDSAKLLVKDGKASLRFMMGGMGVDYLYPSSDPSEASAAGISKAFKYHTAVANVSGIGLIDKYFFTVPVTLASAGDTTIPMSIHSHSENRWIGEHDITFTYRGTEKDIASSLKPAKAKITKVASSKKKAASVSLSKMTSNITDYQVKYSTKKSMKKARSLSTSAFSENDYGEWGAKKSVTVKKLKSGKRYYFQARAYNWVSDSYGSWSKVKSVKVK